MKSKTNDLTGRKFGTLKVIGQGERSKHNQIKWLCECDCGKIYSVLGHSLTTGNTTKCNDHPKNKWIEEKDFILIDVSTPSHPNVFTKIDHDDFKKLMWRNPKTKWLFHDSAPGFDWGCYVIDSNRKSRLHRFIMGLDDATLIVDHINGDTLDNRKSNLRVITRAENNKNMRKRRNNTSGFQGVVFKDGLWAATIQCEGKTHFLGSFDTTAEANAAYRGAAKVLGFSKRHGKKC